VFALSSSVGVHDVGLWREDFEFYGHSVSGMLSWSNECGGKRLFTGSIWVDKGLEKSDDRGEYRLGVSLENVVDSSFEHRPKSSAANTNLNALHYLSASTMADVIQELDVPTPHTTLPEDTSNRKSITTEGDEETEPCPLTTDHDELRANLDKLVDDMIALSPPGKSPYDDSTWTPQELRITDFPDAGIFSALLREAWDDASDLQSLSVYATLNINAFRTVEWNDDLSEFFEPWGRYWRWDSIQWLGARFQSVDKLLWRMRNVFRREMGIVEDALLDPDPNDAFAKSEIDAFAEVGMDAIVFVILACRRLVQLETQQWEITTVYPEKEFVLRLYDLALDAVLAMEWLHGYEVDFEKKTSVYPGEEDEDVGKEEEEGGAG
jgi:hypothetical protein